MSEEIFVNTGTSFQQPYIARQPASGRTPAIGTVEARTPTNVQTPFTYSNRTPFTYRNPVSGQQPYIAQGRQPGEYARQGQTPFTYARQAQTPATYQARQPGTYARQGQTPLTYQHRTPSTYTRQGQLPSTYQARQPSTYTHVNVNYQTPFTYSARQPSTYTNANVSYQTPFTYSARQPSTYTNANVSYQTPFTYNARSPFTYSSTQNVQIPFAWGSLSGTVDIDVDIQNAQSLAAGDGWSFASTNFTVLSSGASGGTIQVSSHSADDDDFYSSDTATPTRNLTYTGGLDSLEGRFVYTGANFDTAVNGGTASVAMIWHKTTKISLPSTVPHDENGMTIANGSVVHGITTEFSSSTGNSGWVALGRNAFTNTGDCSMILSVACNSGGNVNDYGDGRIDGTWKLELRANGNSSAFTVWNKSANILAERFVDTSS